MKKRWYRILRDSRKVGLGWTVEFYNPDETLVRVSYWMTADLALSAGAYWISGADDDTLANQEYRHGLLGR